MNENLFKMLSVISVAFFVAGALTLFFVLYRSSAGTIALVNNSMNDKGTVYEAFDQEERNTDVKGSHIAGSIKKGLETDIFIDAVYVSKTQDSHSFDYGLIDTAAWYSVEYQHSPMGEITLVLYEKRQP